MSLVEFCGDAFIGDPKEWRLWEKYLVEKVLEDGKKLNKLNFTENFNVARLKISGISEEEQVRCFTQLFQDKCFFDSPQNVRQGVSVDEINTNTHYVKVNDRMVLCMNPEAHQVKAEKNEDFTHIFVHVVCNNGKAKPDEMCMPPDIFVGEKSVGVLVVVHDRNTEERIDESSFGEDCKKIAKEKGSPYRFFFQLQKTGNMLSSDTLGRDVFKIFLSIGITSSFILEDDKNEEEETESPMEVDEECGQFSLSESMANKRMNDAKREALVGPLKKKLREGEEIQEEFTDSSSFVTSEGKEEGDEKWECPEKERKDEVEEEEDVVGVENEKDQGEEIVGSAKEIEEGNDDEENKDSGGEWGFCYFL